MFALGKGRVRGESLLTACPSPNHRPRKTEARPAPAKSGNEGSAGGQPRKENAPPLSQVSTESRFQAQWEGGAGTGALVRKRKKPV